MIVMREQISEKDRVSTGFGVTDLYDEVGTTGRGGQTGRHMGQKQGG